MASLTNTKIKDTYDGLLKTTDNDALGGTYKLITDGLGNSSGLYLGTGGRLGIGTSSPDHKLHLEESDTTSVFLKTENTAGSLLIGNNSSGNSFVSSQISGKDLLFETANSEKMRLDSSGNLGIGLTSTNSVKLAITGNSGFPATSGTTQTGLLRLKASNNATLDMGADHTTAAGWLQVTDVADLSNEYNLLLQPNGGNVGIGTSSPSASLSIDKTSVNQHRALDLENDSITYSMYIDQDNVGTDSWSLFDTTNSQTALRYLPSASGYWQFYTNNTERMRIDSSGNVGINCSPSGAKLDVLGNFRVRRELASTQYTEIESGGGQSFIRAINGAAASYQALIFESGNNTTTTERMRIDSSGRVGIGTSSPSTPLEVNVTGNNTVFSLTRDTGTNGELTIRFDGANANFDSLQGGYSFKTNSTERMQITSGGSLLIGTTSSGGAGGVTITPADSAGAPSYVTNRNSTTAASTIFEFRNGGSAVGSITHSSSVTSYNSASDYRLKENVVDMTGALDRVDQLEPKRFNFIADEDTTVDGFLAHEVQDIVPEAVTGEKDAVDDEGNPQYQGIDQSKIVPLLVGAIKELKAEIETLKSQINS